MSSDEIQVGSSLDATARRFSRTVRVGRAPSNDIVLDHPAVSERHLELRRGSDGWEVVDLESEQGTFLDGHRVSRARVRGRTTVRLGADGPELRASAPRLSIWGWTPLDFVDDVTDRYFSDEAPEGMSSRTAMIRAAFQKHRDQTTRSWLKRIRQLRVVVGLLAVVAVAAGGFAWWQARRVAALRRTAASVFNTMKALELDVRRLQATAGPDPSIEERRGRLEAQYDGLIKTLALYSDRTPADVRLIYRTIRRLGESEAVVPREALDEIRKVARQWTAGDLQVSLARGTEQHLGPLVADILRQHHLPREFFYIALQESKLDPRAVGPATASGVPKGLWQLIPATATAYGLTLGPLQGDRAFDPLDERHDPAKATAAAARYLQDIYTTDAQASGLLVLASYNMGETRMRSLIRSLPESPAERNFWTLLEKRRADVPNESYHYVLRVVAAAAIGADPKAFGLDVAPPLGRAEEGSTAPSR